MLTTPKTQDILCPNCRRKKTELIIKQKEYSDDGLSGYTVSSLKAVRHRLIDILFVFMVCSFFSACSPGLEYLQPNDLTFQSFTLYLANWLLNKRVLLRIHLTWRKKELWWRYRTREWVKHKQKKKAKHLLHLHSQPRTDKVIKGKLEKYARFN